MANRPRDPHFAAQVVADATLLGPSQAAIQHGIGATTLQRYRERLREDPELAQAVTEKLQLQDQAWANQIPEAIEAGIQFLRRAAQEMDPTDPQAVFAIGGAVKMLAEIAEMRRVVSARLGSQ